MYVMLVGDITGEMWILASDYDNYAIAYSCKDMFSIPIGEYFLFFCFGFNGMYMCAMFRFFSMLFKSIERPFLLRVGRSSTIKTSFIQSWTDKISFVEVKRVRKRFGGNTKVQYNYT